MRRSLLALLVLLMLPASAFGAGDVGTGPLEGGLVLVSDGAVWIEDDGRFRSAAVGGRPDGTRRRLLSGQFVDSLSSDGDRASLTVYPRLWTATVGSGPSPIEGLPDA